ncbi:efflux RND transporter permease subunit [Solimonas marina]|uniref:Efflux pump membrane transporter n=1 Tax=Solimonas marina TaxID=2714601 RepID=A0A969W647_9GAMM|nr:multidrug efflux RND transporter permease subunit [Solimonas marina]NKF21356.1 efflux RND transporter permease subunit [Solimonas marina]
MKLTHFFIERPIFAGVLSFLVFVAGLLAIFRLPISEYPEVVPPTVVVTAQYPGATAQQLADTIATPLEQEIVGVQDMIYMNSLAQQDGTLQLTVTFKLGTDIDRAQVQVQNRVQQALPRLPQEVQAAGVTTRKSSPNLTMVVHLFSPDGRYDGLYLRNLAVIQVRDQLARLPGAGDVQIFGSGDYAMRIWLDPQKLASRDLTVNDVIAAVREQNVQVAAGSVGAPPLKDSPAFQLAIDARGRLKDAQQFGDIIIKTGADGEVTHLSDVARVQLGAGEYALRSLLDNHSAVALPIFLQPGANALDLARDVRAEMAELKKTAFPEGVDYSIVYDPTVFVRQSIHAVIETLLEALLLVVIVVILFLQTWRAALIPIIAVPVAIIGSFAAMAAFGFSINTLTLFGLVLAVGIVVDDAIVVVENIERGIADGLTPRAAAHRSMNEVAGPIIAISLVLCAVFVPPAFVGGFNGQFYQQFALVIAFAAVISAFNSLTLSPALAALLLRPHGAPPDRVQRAIDGAFGWLFRPFNRVFAKGANGYQRGVRKVLRLGSIALIVYVGLIALTAFGFSKAPAGFIPAQDKGYLVTVVQLPPGSSIERTEAVVKRVGEIGMKQAGISHAVQFPGLSVNGFTRASDAAIVFWTLKDFEDRKGLRAPQIAAALNQKLGAIDDALVLTVLPPPILGLGTAGGFKAQLEDHTNAGPAALYDMTQTLVNKARQNPALAGVFSTYEINAPQLYADVDRTKVKQLGINLDDVFRTMQVYLGSYYINDFNAFGRTFRVIAQADGNFRERPQDALLLKTRNADGEMVPLASVLSLKESFGTNLASRYNGFPSSDINGGPAPGYSSGQAMAALEQVAKETLPPGVDIEWTDLAFQQLGAAKALAIVLPLAVLLVFLVLAAQYESLLLPLAVILIVPMTILSALAGIFLMKSEVNIFTQIGLFVLVGLAAKNAILIVEFARELQAGGLSPIAAALEACRLRLRPILMTSFAFIFGVLPLMLATGVGAEMRQAMGIAVFFGMIGVTFFGLFLTPLFYVVLQRFAPQRQATSSDDTPPATLQSPKPAPSH